MSEDQPFEKWSASICPVCFRRIPIRIYEEDGVIYLEKTCPEHGKFEDVYWGDAEYFKWVERNWNTAAYMGRGLNNPNTKMIRGCPLDCGLCPQHKTHTVLGIIDITNRCNMACPICIGGDEVVLIKNSMKCKLVKLREFVDSLYSRREPIKLCRSVDYVNVEGLGIKVPVLGDGGKILWADVKRVYRKKAPNSLLEVRTSTGRRVILTPDHKLFMVDGNGVHKVKALDIKPGDRILVVRNLEIGESREVLELNVLKYLKTAPEEELRSLTVRGVKSYFLWIKKSKGLESFKEIGEAAGVKFSYDWNRRDSMPLQSFYKIVEKFGIPGEMERRLRIGVRGKRCSIPSTFPINEQLARFIALFVAEGNFNYIPNRTYSIIITASDVDYVSSLIFHLNLRPRVICYKEYGHPTKTPQVVVSCKPFFLLLYYGLRLGDKAFRKRLPSFTPSLPRRIIVALLSELFDRDGYVIRASRRTFVGFKTTSRELLQQLQYILSMFNIHSRVYSRPSTERFPKEHSSYELHVSTKPELEKLCSILDPGCKVRKRLEELLPRSGKTAVEILGDLIVDEVRDVVVVEYTGEYVYDLEVNFPSHSYIVGTVIVSNCFAYAGAVDYVYEPSYEQIVEMIRLFRANSPWPANALQFSGGEPTLRNDLPALIREAKKAGIEHVEVNTNGIRLAEDIDYYRSLLDAGLDTLYLQFDGLRDDIYVKLRARRDFVDVKKKVIENARKLGHRSIVLVVTLAKGVNDRDLGDIIRYAIQNKDVVRCVNIQPISMAGRARKEEMRKLRITIPDAIKLIEEQTNGAISRWSWRPVNWPVPIARGMEILKDRMYPEFTMHPHCGMATFIVAREDGSYVPITELVDVDKFAEVFKDIYNLGITGHRRRAKVEMLRLLTFVRSELIRNLVKDVITKGSYEALARLMYNMIMIGIMHFQDVWNIDLDRVNRCAIHYATPDGKLRSFCTYNTIYRSQVEEKFKIPIEEWTRKTGKKLSDYA